MPVNTARPKPVINLQPSVEDSLRTLEESFCIIPPSSDSAFEIS